MSNENKSANAIVEAVIEQIGVKEIAKKIAPSILVEIEKTAVESVRNMDLGDILYEIFQSPQIQKELTLRFLNGIKGISK